MNSFRVRYFSRNGTDERPGRSNSTASAPVHFSDGVVRFDEDSGSDSSGGKNTEGLRIPRQRNITTCSDSDLKNLEAIEDLSGDGVETAVEVLDDSTFADLERNVEARRQPMSGEFKKTWSSRVLKNVVNYRAALNSPSRRSTESVNVPPNTPNDGESIEPSASSMADTESLQQPAPDSSADKENNGNVISESAASEDLSSQTESVNYETGPKTAMDSVSLFAEKYSQMPLKNARISLLIALIAITYVFPNIFVGILWGFYGASIFFLITCVSEPLKPSENFNEFDNFVKKIDGQKNSTEFDENVIYKGWMNILDGRYDPRTFHVNALNTVLVRLDGKMLRISRPDRLLLKHGFHTDPTLTEAEPRMLGQTIFDLTNATIKLRPRRLARRRWFSRKYPICIRLSSDREEQCQDSVIDENVTEVKGTVEEDENDDSQRSTPKRLITDRSVEIGEEPEGYLSSSEDEDPSTILHSQSETNIAAQTGRIIHRTNQRTVPRMERPRPAKTIYLFARCAREKEQWFHRLRRACNKYAMPKDIADAARQRRSSFPHLSETENPQSRDYLLYIMHACQFKKHLDDIFIEKVPKAPTGLDGIFSMDLGKTRWTEPEHHSGRELVLVANLIASRVFYDFCRDKYWCKAVQNKIQTKLATLHLPYFIENLELSGFDIGTAIPRIEKIYSPSFDEWGVWMDFEINYEGMIKLALETRVNVMKIKEQHDSTEASHPNAPCSTSFIRPKTTRYSDEEMPESPETSPDEDYGSKLKLNDNANKEKKKTGQKILNLVDKIASSNLFKEASELKPIRKMMEEISSTRLMLNVEVTKLSGIMTINVGPPPSDRLWYGFRRPPQMSVRAVPQVGDRSVVFSTLSDWIEGKIVQLLEKSMVVPNMDDVVVPIMSGNELLQSTLNR